MLEVSLLWPPRFFPELMGSNAHTTSRLFQFYRDIAATIYPVLPDIQKFEAKLSQLLRNRALSNGNWNTPEGMERPYGVSVAYFGLLFAILAAGCQSSDLPGRNRELTSQVYGNSVPSMLSSTVN